MFDQNITYGPGTGTFASHTFEILIMLLGAFILGIWLGWAMWGRYRQMAEKLRLDNDSLTATLTALRAELDANKVRLTNLESERTNLAARLDLAAQENTDHQLRLGILENDVRTLSERNRQLETELGLSAPAPDAPDAEGITLEIMPPPADDNWNPGIAVEEPAPTQNVTLQITPTPADHDNWNPGIPTEDASAFEESVVDEPEAMLVTEDVPPPPAPTQPTAPMVVVQPIIIAPTSDSMTVTAGEPQVLNATQGATVTTLEPQVIGPRSEGDSVFGEDDVDDTPAHTEPIFATAVPPGQRDDLKIVEGIGPKIEELLFKNGVDSYQELAATPVERLREILAEAGPRYSMHDPGTWSAQALLAANGEWENLKAYQDFLNAGKRPS